MTRVRFARSLVVATAAALVTLWGMGPAPAHEDDEVGGTAGDLVRQAIALIVNRPDDVETIRDKIDDAAKADDTSGVDLAVVGRALGAFDSGDLHQTRALLEQSIGAQPHVDVGAAEPPPIRETTPTTAPPMGMPEGSTSGASPTMTIAPPMTMATGAEPGTELIAEPLDVRPHLDGEDWVLLATSIAVGLVGVWLGLRHRPRRVKVA